MVDIRFSLKPLEHNTVEINSHRVKYICHIEATSLSLKVFKENALQEEADFQLKANSHVVSLELKDHANKTLRVEMRKSADSLSTVISLNGHNYKIAEADVARHGFELAKTLKGIRGPRMKYVAWFMKDLRNHPRFRQAVSGKTRFQDLVKGNTVIPGFCAVACACCGVLIVEPIPGDEIPCCSICLFCFKYLS